jgi:lipid A 3-O-deacylase
LTPGVEMMPQKPPAVATAAADALAWRLGPVASRRGTRRESKMADGTRHLRAGTAGRGILTAVLAAGAAGIVALSLPSAGWAQNITEGALKLGVLKHDVSFFGGRERGIDINPEVIFRSPIPDSWAAEMPWYLRFATQPRPTVGALVNTAGATNQGYFGATWTWLLASNVLMPEDGFTFGIFFGPGFNDGRIGPATPTRKALGSHVLFREALELGYRITPQYEISVYVDHVSNAGFARYNQSLNELGGRFGIRF